MKTYIINILSSCLYESKFYQANFDELWRKFITYSSGEQLFGLPVTDYEVLHKVR